MSSIPDEKTPGQTIDDLGVGDSENPPTAITDRNLSRLFDLPSVFCKEGLHVDVCDISVTGSSNSLTSAETTGGVWQTIQTDDLLQEHLRASTPDVRIISVVSEKSIRPLKITKSSAKAIFTHYAIGPEIYSIFCPFGRKPKNSDAGLGSMKVKYRTDGSCDMQYLLSYIEETNRAEKWTMRQVGVFHRFVPNGPGSLWIFLHAGPRERVMECVNAAIPGPEGGIPQQQHWSSIHLLVISTCLENWQWYLRDFNKDLEKSSDLGLTLNLRSDDVFTERADDLTRLQYIQDRTLSLATRLHSSLATVRKLGEVGRSLLARDSFSGSDDDFQKLCDETANFESELEGHIQDTKLLQKRAREALALLSVTLNLQNQEIVVNINQKVLHLTQGTVDDSATVRVITIVTLVYLPASFVTSFFGMNLFTFQNPGGSGGFSISRQFWLFVAVAVPLTILTLTSWYWFSYKGIIMKRKPKVRIIDVEAMAGATAGATAEVTAGAAQTVGLFKRTFSRLDAGNRRHTT